MTDRPADQPSNDRRSDRRAYREVLLPITSLSSLLITLDNLPDISEKVPAFTPRPPPKKIFVPVSGQPAVNHYSNIRSGTTATSEKVPSTSSEN